MPLKDMDLAIIDLGDPWEVLPQVRKMLKSSGSVAAICPTMNQLEKLSVAFVEDEFTDIECTENILLRIVALQILCDDQLLQDESYFLCMPHRCSKLISHSKTQFQLQKF